LICPQGVSKSKGAMFVEELGVKVLVLGSTPAEHPDPVPFPTNDPDATGT